VGIPNLRLFKQAFALHERTAIFVGSASGMRCGEELTGGCANQLLGRASKKALQRFVHDEVAPLHIQQPNGVRDVPQQGGEQGFALQRLLAAGQKLLRHGLALLGLRLKLLVELRQLFGAGRHLSAELFPPATEHFIAPRAGDQEGCQEARAAQADGQGGPLGPARLRPSIAAGKSAVEMPLGIAYLDLLPQLVS
jgi:hypothetical protein